MRLWFVPGNPSSERNCPRQKSGCAERLSRYSRYPPVEFTGIQARAIGRGFARAVEKSRFTIWACSILPEHVHAVIMRHTYKVEQIVNLLKGEGTKQLNEERLHPLASYAAEGRKPHSPWADRRWKVFLDSEMAIEEAIQFVEDNPIKEGKTRQRWPFVTPFRGLESGWVPATDCRSRQYRRHERSRRVRPPDYAS